jgi:hypothetical protein
MPLLSQLHVNSYLTFLHLFLVDMLRHWKGNKNQDSKSTIFLPSFLDPCYKNVTFHWYFFKTFSGVEVITKG